MAEALTWDLLVHPFYSLAFVPFADEANRLVENANLLDRVWRNRILQLKSQSDRGLIVVKPDFARAKRLIERFIVIDGPDAVSKKLGLLDMALLKLPVRAQGNL